MFNSNRVLAFIAFLVFVLIIVFLFFSFKEDERIQVELIKGQKNNVVIYSKDNCKFINYSYYCWED